MAYCFAVSTDNDNVDVVVGAVPLQEVGDEESMPSVHVVRSSYNRTNLLACERPLSSMGLHRHACTVLRFPTDLFREHIWSVV